MMCPRCNVLMTLGIAIDPREECCAMHSRVVIQNADEMELIDVLKCHQCGYSNDGK